MYHPPYVRPKLYPSLAPGQPGADEAAEKANDQAMQGYRSKNYQLCYDAASEAIRLNPNRVAYYGNRAAAALKLRGQQHLRQAALDCRDALRLDPAYVKGYVRSAEAHFAMGEPVTVSMAVEMYEKALKLDPDNKSIQQGLHRVRLVFESDYAS